MQLNQIFDEKVEGNQWILTFKEFIWIIPAQIRCNEALCNELFLILEILEILSFICSHILKIFEISVFMLYYTGNLGKVSLHYSQDLGNIGT